MKRKQVTIKINDYNLKDCIQEFIDDCSIRNLSSDTLSNYMHTLSYFIDYTGNKSMEDVSQRDINDFTRYMRKKGNTDSTIATRLSILKIFFNSRGITFDYPPIKNKAPQKVPYTKDELKLLLASPKRQTFTEYRNWCIANLLYSTGCRSSSCANLKIKDIDFINNTIYFSKSKGNKPYYVPLGLELKKVLKKYLSIYQHEDDDYLFITIYGDQLKRESMKLAMINYNKSRGVARTSMHLYRHTFAVDYLRSGGNIMYLKTIMNHHDIRITQKYLNIDIEDVKSNFDDYCPLNNMKRKAIKLNI